MSSLQDAVLDYDDSAESFSGFSPVESEEDLPDRKKKTKKTMKLKSVVAKTSSKKDKCSSKNKPSPKKTKSNDSSGVRGTSSKQTTSGSTSDTPEIGFDLSKLSLSDIDKLREVLGINTPMDMEMDSEYEYSKENRPNLRIEFDSRDLSDNEDCGKVNKNMSKGLCDVLFDGNTSDNSEKDMWSLPKLKVPQKGKAIAQSLADMVNCACASQCDIDGVLAKYKIPENCDKVSPPVVNGEVWKIMEKRSQSQDKGMVDIQSMVAAGLTSTMKLAEVLKKEISENNEAKTLIADSIVTLGQVQYFLSIKRRYMIRPALKKKYQGLCNFNMPITSKLFGDDVTKDIKACESMSFLGRDYGYNNNRGRGNPRFGHRQYPPRNNNNYGGGRRYSPYPARGQGRPNRSGFGGYRIPRKSATATVSTAPNDQN